VGIPLPFLSHGGSSMMTNMICIGTIMAVDRWSRRGPPDFPEKCIKPEKFI
jgi:rod shape determining protein RodA